MNVLKNFEALFVVALGLASAANYVLDHDGGATPAVASQVAPAVSTVQTAQVVVVSAKRLTAEQKRQSLIDERKAGLAASADLSKM